MDRALSSPHLQLPDRLSKHVVIGLCSMDTRTMGWLLQYISALRYTHQSISGMDPGHSKAAFSSVYSEHAILVVDSCLAVGRRLVHLPIVILGTDVVSWHVLFKALRCLVL